jgi:hypothetical protein
VWSRRRLLMLPTTAIVLAPVTAMALATGNANSVAAGAGCQGLSAVAHHANQQVFRQHLGDRPSVCGRSTGWPAVENRIEVTNDGTVLYEPALQGGPVASGDGHVPGWGTQFGAAVTSNGGSQWRAISVPVSIEDHVFDGQVDNNLYVDHVTGRLFWYMYNGGPGTPQVPYTCGSGKGAVVAFTSDDGKTWSKGSDLDHDCAENPTMISARSAISGEHLDGYPDVVYLCGDNASTGIATTGTLGYSCSKSLDGGQTWRGTTLDSQTGQGFYSGLEKDNTDPYPQCSGQSSSAGANVQPLPDGTLLVGVSCNSEMYLSESKDEGATWKIVHKLPHTGTLRGDAAGNLYLLEGPAGGTPFQPQSRSGDKLLLSHSTDGGAHWSTDLNIIAPGVKSVGTFMFVQGTFTRGLIGHIAVAYYGIRDDQSVDARNGYSDGFITATQDALAPNPVFWSGQVNKDGKPLLYNTRTDGNIGITVLDFNGGAWSPDGKTVWGSWVQDCGANFASDASCQSRYPHTNPGNPDDGYAGRLTW